MLPSELRQGMVLWYFDSGDRRELVQIDEVSSKWYSYSFFPIAHSEHGTSWRSIGQIRDDNVISNLAPLSDADRVKLAHEIETEFHRLVGKHSDEMVKREAGRLALAKRRPWKYWISTWERMLYSDALNQNSHAAFYAGLTTYRFAENAIKSDISLSHDLNQNMTRFIHEWKDTQNQETRRQEKNDVPLEITLLFCFWIVFPALLLATRALDVLAWPRGKRIAVNFPWYIGQVFLLSWWLLPCIIAVSSICGYSVFWVVHTFEWENVYAISLSLFAGVSVYTTLVASYLAYHDLFEIHVYKWGESPPHMHVWS